MSISIKKGQNKLCDPFDHCTYYTWCGYGEKLKTNKMALAFEHF